MRRLVFYAAIIIASIFVLGMVSGCGQQTQQINSSLSSPSNVSIKGTVYGYKSTEVYSSFTTGDPIAGADVALSGGSGIWKTTTDAKGEYSFNGVPDGSYVLMATAEGYQEISSIFSNVGGSIKPSSGVPADGTTSIFEIKLLPWPIITGYSPASGGVVSNDQSFKITFNETMDATTVQVKLIPQELRISAAAQNSAQVNLSWDGTGKELTITPTGQLISNEVYKLEVQWDFDWSTGKITGPQDIQGNKMITPFWLQYIQFPVETKARDNFVLYRVTTGGSLPGTPSNLKINYFNGTNYTTEADAYDFWISIYDNDWMNFSWDSPTSGGPITGYNIYAANGSSKEYVKINSSPIMENKLTTSGYTFERAFWPSGIPWSDPVCGGNYPFINNPCRVKVVAFNGDGEGPGIDLDVQDNVSPKILGSKSANSGYAGERLADDYYLPAISASNNNVAYILLSEPVQPSTVSTNTVTISGVTLAVTLLTQSAEYLNVTGVLNVLSVIKLDAGTTDIRTKIVTIGTGLKDLAGNSPAAGSGDTIVLP